MNDQERLEIMKKMLASLGPAGPDKLEGILSLAAQLPGFLHEWPADRLFEY